jgi:myo-inositol-1(or 4)-monophosphatase
MKNFLQDITKNAGKIAFEHIGNKEISYKSKKNLVTNIDIKIEKFIKQKIKQKYPNHNIISEESEKINNKSDYTWIIDPIDGTTNYAHNNPFFCISIALAKKNNITFASVYSPFFNEHFYSELQKGAFLNNKKIHVSNIKEMNKAMIYYHVGYRKNLNYNLKIEKTLIKNFERVRAFGSLALETCYVAAGRGEAVLRFSNGANIWDYAAAALILKEAGGKVTDLKNKKITKMQASNFLGTNSFFHDQLINLIKIKGDKK